MERGCGLAFCVFEWDLDDSILFELEIVHLEQKLKESDEQRLKLKVTVEQLAADNASLNDVIDGNVLEIDELRQQIEELTTNNDQMEAKLLEKEVKTASLSYESLLKYKECNAERLRLKDTIKLLSKETSEVSLRLKEYGETKSMTILTSCSTSGSTSGTTRYAERDSVELSLPNDRQIQLDVVEEQMSTRTRTVTRSIDTAHRSQTMSFNEKHSGFNFESKFANQEFVPRYTRPSSGQMVTPAAAHDQEQSIVSGTPTIKKYANAKMISDMDHQRTTIYINRVFDDLYANAKVNRRVFDDLYQPHFTSPVRVGERQQIAESVYRDDSRPVAFGTDRFWNQMQELKAAFARGARIHQ